MEKAEKFVSGMSYEEFAKDDKTIFAVIRALEIVGEAVKHIPLDVRRKYSSCTLERYCWYEGCADTWLFWG